MLIYKVRRRSNFYLQNEKNASQLHLLFDKKEPQLLHVKPSLCSNNWIAITFKSLFW